MVALTIVLGISTSLEILRIATPIYILLLRKNIIEMTVLVYTYSTFKVLHFTIVTSIIIHRNLSTQYDKKLSQIYVEERKANSRTHGINNDDATITGMVSNKSISITISTNNN